MTQITSKFDDVSRGFINIYQVLDNELQRSDIFIPFLNSMLKLQACISHTGNATAASNEAMRIALDSIKRMKEHINNITETNLVAPALTDPMIKECETLRILIEEYTLKE